LNDYVYYMKAGGWDSCFMCPLWWNWS